MVINITNSPKKQKKNRNYLYRDVLTISNSLWERIKDLSETEQTNYAFIYSTIHYHQSTKRNYNIFVNIGRKVWLNKIGNGYKKYINKMVEWNEIEILKVENENGDLVETYSVNQFTKSYKVSKSSIISGIRSYDFRRKLFRILKDDKEDVERIFSNPILKHQYNVLQNITTLEMDDFERTNVPSKDFKIDRSLKSIWSGKTSLKQSSNTGRITHSGINSPKVSRRYWQWIKEPSKPMILHDFKCCQPTLLLKYAEDLREEYIKLLEGDFYTTIIKQSSKPDTEREVGKKMFSQYVSGYVKNIFFDFFKNNFPPIHSFITENKDKMARILQQMESQVFVNDLITYCIDNNIDDVLIMNDGFISNGDNDKEIIDLITSKYYEILNYNITIKSCLLKDDALKQQQKGVICVDNEIEDTEIDLIDFNDLKQQSLEKNNIYNKLKSTFETVKHKYKCECIKVANHKKNGSIDINYQTLNRLRYSKEQTYEKIKTIEEGYNIPEDKRITKSKNIKRKKITNPTL